jgi:hypothetical protein
VQNNLVGSDTTTVSVTPNLCSVTFDLPVSFLALISVHKS